MISKISNTSVDTFINIVLKRVKIDSSTTKQKILFKILNSLSEDDKIKLLDNFVKDLFSNQLDYLKQSNISDKLFELKNGEKILKSDINPEIIGVQLSNFIWSDVAALQMLINFYKSSEDTYNNQEIDVNTDIDSEVKSSESEEIEPSATENFMRMADFSKKVLKNLKIKATEEQEDIYKIVNDSSQDDDVIKAIKIISEDISKLSDADKKEIIGTVFKEYKNQKEKFFVVKDTDYAADIFSLFILINIPDAFLNKIKEVRS
jgi:hypothetical protein